MELQNKNKDRKGRRKGSVDLDTMIYGKVPPQAKDMETAVLGAIMLEPAAFDVVNGMLQPESFYVDANQRIYRAIQSLQRKGQAYDILMVVEELKRTDELEQCGGPYYVTRLTNEVVSAANIEDHARVIVQKFMAREAIRLAGEIIRQAYEDSTDVFEMVDNAETSFSQLSNRTAVQGYCSISTAVVREYARLEEARHQQQKFTGVPTGLKVVDQFTYGWQAGDLILLAARPSRGKTAFALNLAINAARNSLKPTPVGFFSLEMTIPKITRRMTAAVSNTPLKLIQQAKLTDEDMSKLHKHGFQPLADIPIWLDNTPAMSLVELRAKARRMKNKDNVGLIIIDYLQLMKTGSSTNSQNREREISDISAGIKALALSLNIPIIALSQLSRKIEDRPGGVFMLSDLRDSGSLEQDADVIMYIHRPSPDEINNSPELRDTAKIVFAKNRDGELGDITLNFYGETQKWKDLELPWGAGANISSRDVRDYTTPADQDEEDPF